MKRGREKQEPRFIKTVQEQELVDDFHFLFYFIY